MSKEIKEKGISRRDFMKTAGMAAALGSALSVSFPKKAQAAKTLKIGLWHPLRDLPAGQAISSKEAMRWP